MGYRERTQRLAETFQPRQEWWSRVFASPVANLILRVVADWPGITPNRLTFLSFFLTLVTAALIFAGDSNFMIIAGLILQLAYVVDCMDGQLARYQGTSSRMGSFYDKWSDFVKFPLVIAALTWVSFDASASVFPAALGMLCIFLIGYLPYLKMFAEQELGITLWSGLNGKGFAQRNLRFFLFEEAQWYLIVSVCLFVDRPLLALILLASTQGVVAIVRTWRIFKLINSQ